MNPEVLDFVNDDRLGTFVVKASVPLDIENRALGYKIHFLLEEFQIDDNTVLRYTAKTKFEDLQPATNEEEEVWKVNRKKAYYGSRRHFLSVLAQGKVQEEGFEIHQVPNLQPSSKRYQSAKLLVDSKKLVLGTEYGFQKRIVFPDYLEIIYTREPAETSYRLLANPDNPGAVLQVSWITMNRLTVLFTTDGHTLEPYSMKSFGYWAFERVAELLPMDYGPDEAASKK